MKPLMRALLFGQQDHIFESVPALMSRAGLRVTVISTSAKLAACPYVDQFIHVGSADELVRAAADESMLGYGIIVAGDDETLLSVKTSNLNPEEKVRLLPIMNADGLAHIASKFGLSRVLGAAKVNTPDFRIVNNRPELEAAISEIGFPCMIKGDGGGCGDQVHELPANLDLAPWQADTSYPLIVQRKIEGELVDLSGLFLEGRPVFFSYSEVV